jgi:hypothetical protein
MFILAGGRLKRSRPIGVRDVTTQITHFNKRGGGAMSPIFANGAISEADLANTFPEPVRADGNGGTFAVRQHRSVGRKNRPRLRAPLGW